MKRRKTFDKLERLATAACSSTQFKSREQDPPIRGLLALSWPKFRYGAVAVGGTFDILHKGHEQLLSKAFRLGSIVFVGLSGNSLVSVLHKNHPVKSFKIRRRALRKFLSSHGWLSRARIAELKDPYGPATRCRRLHALVVSEETRLSGLRVNAIRRGRGLKPLRIYVVKMVKAEDGKTISVTRIRRGEIDSNGGITQPRHPRFAPKS